MSPFLNPIAHPDDPSLGRRLIRRVCTSNPFYVLSAGLFLVGLRLSFGDQASDVDGLALLAGLAGYTFLLAAAALLLVRYGGAWDDVRTVLLLSVLMFLATSVTFDDRLGADPARAKWYYLGGLALAIGVSEMVLRGIHLRLPAGYRLPYYLLLALFFLYPLTVAPFGSEPRGERLMWMLWGFSPAAGLIVLTLLPAARRGAAYVRENGSPWPWPFYPWSLFVVLGFGVVGRSWLITKSLQPINGADWENVIFGPYFLVPFGLASAAVVLEVAHAARNRWATMAALLAPLGLVILAGIGHKDETLYREFLDLFILRFGATPLFLTLLAAAGFYVYAAVRDVPWALDGLSVVFALLAVYGPESLTLRDATSPRPDAIVAAGLLQFGLGILHSGLPRCAAGSFAFVLAAVLSASPETTLTLRVFHSLNVLIAVLLVMGAIFHTRLAVWFRGAAAVAAFALGTAVAFRVVGGRFALPESLTAAYPLFASLVLLGYAVWLQHRLSFASAGLILIGWLGINGWRIYRWMREDIAGLDYIAVGLLLFPLAVLVSLRKAAALRTAEVPSLKLPTRVRRTR